MESNPYYVYAYLDPRKPGPFIYGEYTFSHEPFYIGKGKGRRWLAHLKETPENTINIFKTSKIEKIRCEKLEPILVKILLDVSDADACSLEIKLIDLIGRKNVVNGPLTNLTNGGDTTSGTIYSDESRALMSAQRKGKKQTPAQYAANCSRGPMSEEHRRKISESQKGIKRLSDEKYKEIADKNRGQKRSQETRKLLSEQRKGKKQTEAQYAATLDKASKKRDLSGYMTFEEFKNFVKNLHPNLHKIKSLMAFIRNEQPPRVPVEPRRLYRNRGDWTSWDEIFNH